jgi:hypothetical protein
VASDQEHRNASSIFAREPDPDFVAVCGIERDLTLGPESCSAALGRIAVNLNWFAERLGFEQQLVSVSSHKANAIRFLNRQLAKKVTREIENVDLWPEASDVGNKDAIPSRHPVLDRTIAFRDDISEKGPRSAFLTNLDNSQVGGVAVGDSQNPTALEQQRSEFVLGVLDQLPGSAFAARLPQIEICAGFVEETDNKKTKLFLARNDAQPEIAVFASAEDLLVMI